MGNSSSGEIESDPRGKYLVPSLSVGIEVDRACRVRSISVSTDEGYSARVSPIVHTACSDGSRMVHLATTIFFDDRRKTRTFFFFRLGSMLGTKKGKLYSYHNY